MLTTLKKLPNFMGKLDLSYNGLSNYDLSTIFTPPGFPKLVDINLEGLALGKFEHETFDELLEFLHSEQFITFLLSYLRVLSSKAEPIGFLSVPISLYFLGFTSLLMYIAFKLLLNPFNILLFMFFYIREITVFKFFHHFLIFLHLFNQFCLHVLLFILFLHFFVQRQMRGAPNHTSFY